MKLEPRELIGKREGATLEFKSAAALQQPQRIGREVVAMLNARGGSILVGVAEQQGEARSIDPIPDAERAQRRLLDHLVDTIEPTPTESEVAVEAVETDGGTVLRVRVRPEAAKSPYAQVAGNSRTFVVRTGDRVVRMSREDLRSRFRDQGAAADPIDATKGTLDQQLERKARSLSDVLWICVQPTAELDLDLNDPELELLLREPARTGNRETGWNFTWASERVRRHGRRISFGRSGDRMLELQRSGTIELSVPLPRLFWGRNVPPAAKSDREIHPWALCEYATSVLRLAGRLYAGVRDDIDVVIVLALLGARGVSLRPHSFLSADFAAATPKPLENDHLLVEQPLVVRAQRLVEEPDRCAYMLMTRVYESFGYEERHLPSEFDRRTGRLDLPR